MSETNVEVGKKTFWATLDNANAISITPKNGYYAIGEEGEEPCELMSFGSFKSEQFYNVWDQDAVYDSLNDAVNNTSSGPRAGGSKGFRIASSYFQSGDLCQISFYSDRSGSESRLKIATYKNGIYTVAAELDYNQELSGELTGEEMDALGIKRREDGTFKNPVYKHTYDLNESGSIILDNVLLSDSTAGLFVFASSEYPIGSILTHRDAEINHTKFSSIRAYCCYRSLNDAISFFYDGGGTAAPIYIPFFSYSIISNTVSDHTTENFKKYHLSTEDIQEVEKLSYSAPFIEGIKKINRANACFKRIYISHQTLMGNMHNDSQRPSRFTLGNKAIKKISIPLNYGNMWINKEHQDYYRFGLDSSAGENSNTGVNKDYGVAFLPLSLKIAVENPDTDAPVWHKSINAVSQLTTLNPNNYKDWMPAETIWNFEFSEIEYKNNGIWIEVENNLKTIYPFNGEEITLNNLPYDSIAELAISYYQAAFSDNNDYIRVSAPRRGYSINGDNKDIIIEEGNIQYQQEDISVVAPIKIYFDFAARENWYDFIDEHVYQSSLYSYKTVNPADGLNSSINHNMSSAVLNSDFVPKTNSTKGYYLNAVTFLNVNNNYTNNANTYWLLIKDGDKRYISKNGIKIRNSSRFIPTWLFDLDEKINFNASTQIQVGLIKTNDINASFDEIKTPGVNDGGIELKCYQTADRECIINRKGVDDSPNPQRGWVPTILFSFRCNELDDMAQRIAKLENLVISLTSGNN